MDLRERSIWWTNSLLRITKCLDSTRNTRDYWRDFLPRLLGVRCSFDQGRTANDQNRALDRGRPLVMRKLQDPMKIHEPVIQKEDLCENVFRDLTRRTNVIRLNHLVMFGNTSQRLTVILVNATFVPYRAREEFCSFSACDIFRWQFVANCLLGMW